MELGLSPIEGSEQDEVARLRRLVRYQLAVFVSILLHLGLVAIFVLVPFELRRFAPTESETPHHEREVVPITFVAPRPPPARPAPRRSPEVPIPEIPPPRPVPEAALRMQPAPPRPPSIAENRPQPSKGTLGRQGDSPAGGRSGGRAQEARPGSPPAGSDGRLPSGAEASTSIERPMDLAGRLRSFREAIERDGPPAPKAPEGQGSGEGGLDRPDLPGVGFGFGNLEFESSDYDWNDYARVIYYAIWRAWHQRLYTTTSVFERWAVTQRSFMLEHSNRIRFTIARSGAVVGVSLETPSGCEPLDDSAADALREVVLPPLPADFPRGQETIRARFIANGDIRQMRASLEWLKEHGYF